jgi:predicted type IV restriction endonuclease
LAEPLELVKKLKSRLARYKELYSRNEVAVREQIVSPLLSVFGWDTEDPKCVIPEYPVVKGKSRMKIDYALLKRRAILAVVEVKALGKVSEGLGSADKKARAVNARYIIVTDGDTWQIYEISKGAIKLISEWSLLREDPRDVVKKAQVITSIKSPGKTKGGSRRSSHKPLEA